MGMKRTLQEVDPQLLPLGTRVAQWRVTGWLGRGVYGSVYRVEWVGHEEAGPFAMKLAVYPGDERFQREAWLLSHIHSPHVPRLYAQGVWEHPQGAYPFLVMELIEGEPLYVWASRRNPTERQALGVLAHVARALLATQVEALERVRQSGRAEEKVRLFDWGYEHRARVRSPGSVRWAEERDVTVRKEWARHERERRARAKAASRQEKRPLKVRVWGVEGVVSAVGLLLVCLLVASLYRSPETHPFR